MSCTTYSAAEAPVLLVGWRVAAGRLLLPALLFFAVPVNGFNAAPAAASFAGAALRALCRNCDYAPRPGTDSKDHDSYFGALRSILFKERD
jgi:hypothetical protein